MGQVLHCALADTIFDEMARPLNIEVAGALYHVTSRGGDPDGIYRGGRIWRGDRTGNHSLPLWPTAGDAPCHLGTLAHRPVIPVTPHIGLSTYAMRLAIRRLFLLWSDPVWDRDATRSCRSAPNRFHPRQIDRGTDQRRLPRHRD